MAENPDNDNLESYLTQIHTLYGAMQLRDPQYADSFRRALGTIVTMAERGNSLSFIEERLPEARPEKPLEILRELLRREQLFMKKGSIKFFQFLSSRILHQRIYILYPINEIIARHREYLWEHTAYAKL
ncbi:hypothetical protein HYV87_04585 [Candidatus Woesearchaeota archaeon]|nr:hypothetical protein [Candidatus Woesearchaeota archaeon]